MNGQPASRRVPEAYTSTGCCATPQTLQQIREAISAVCQPLADNEKIPARARNWARSVQSAILVLLSGKPSSADLQEAGTLLEKIGKWSMENQEARNRKNDLRVQEQGITHKANSSVFLPADINRRTLDQAVNKKRVFIDLTADDLDDDAEIIRKEYQRTVDAPVVARDTPYFDAPIGEPVVHTYQLCLLMLDSLIDGHGRLGKVNAGSPLPPNSYFLPQHILYRAKMPAISNKRFKLLIRNHVQQHNQARRQRILFGGR